MALNVVNLEGNELADDYTRSVVPQGRWSDAWDVFKSSAMKLILINVFTLITFIPGLVVILFRSWYIGGLGTVYPFNSSILYPFYPDVVGLTERLTLSADILFYAGLIVAGFFASLGIAGSAYSLRKILNTHGEFTVKSYFHGIKVCYFNTVLPVTLFMCFLYGTLLTGDWMRIVIAIGGNKAAAITAFVFTIIATVLVGIYCGWLFAVGTTYKVKFGELFKNAFVLMIGTPLRTVFMAGFSLIPVWFFMIGGFFRILSYITFILIGFSYVIFCWTAFTQSVFDMYVNPALKSAKEQENAKKSPKELEEEKKDEDSRRARELLAAGRSELIARPIKPITQDNVVPSLGKTFTRGDISAVNQSKARLAQDVTAYEAEHKDDPVYAEYNKLFAEREKALRDETDKKGKKKKKISSDNLLK